MVDPFLDLLLTFSSLSIPQDMSIPNKPISPDEASVTHNNLDQSYPNTSSNIPIRKSQRISKPPAHLRDFHCHLLTHSNQSISHSLHHIEQYVSYNNLSPSHRNFVLNVSSHFELQFFHQAVKIPHWRDAMKLELEAMVLNQTSSIVPLPPGKHLVGCRWIYKNKYKADGSLERHKARLVVKGYTQQEGLDYFDTFSPVAKNGDRQGDTCTCCLP